MRKTIKQQFWILKFKQESWQLPSIPSRECESRQSLAKRNNVYRIFNGQSQNVYMESHYNKFQLFNDLRRSFNCNASKNCSRCNRNDYFTSTPFPSVSPASSCCLPFMKYSLPEAFFLHGLINWRELFSTSEHFQRHKSSSANVFNEIRLSYGALFSFRFFSDGIIGIGWKIEGKDGRNTEWNKLRWRW